MSVTSACTVACEAAPLCTVCDMRKRPRGRNIAPEMENGMCGHDCAGYGQEPRAGHLWPGELARAQAETPE